MDRRIMSGRGSRRPESRESVSSRDFNSNSRDYKMRLNLKSDNDSDISDSEASGDEDVPNPLENYWSNFGDSLKRIHDDSETFLIRPKPTFKSSDHFKDVMTNMYGNTEYGVPRAYTKLKNKINRLTNATSIASRLLSQAAKSREEETSETLEEIPGDESADHKELVSELKGAKRGWKLLKRHVNENQMQKKTEQTKLNWDMLAHHVKGMTDLEKARVDLYERYGVIPSLQSNGKVECKNIMWSERAIALNQIHPVQYNVISKTNKEKRRAQSARVRASSIVTIQRPGSEVNNRTRALSVGIIQRPGSEKRYKTAPSSRQSLKRDSIGNNNVSSDNQKR